MSILQKGNKLGVCVHHSVYTPAKNLAELKAQAKLFNGWHKSKSWAETTKTPSDYPYISYHYLMATNGEMLKVTDEKYVKYHAGDNFRGDLSFNLHGIAVCITGNYQNDKPNDKQMEALVRFIRDVEKRYDINARVRGHKETSGTATACPGNNIGTSKSGWLKRVIENVNDKDYPPKPVEPPVEPNCDEFKERIQILEKENKSLRLAVGSLQDQIETLQAGLEKEIGVWTDKYGTLVIEKNRIENEKNEAIRKYKELKESRFMWVVEWLDKVVPKKND